MLLSHWIATRCSSPPISTIKSNSPPTATTITLKMAAAMFVETLDNFQPSTRLTPESRSFTLNSILENLTTRKNNRFVCFNLHVFEQEMRI
jgi:hypothetical protein